MAKQYLHLFKNTMIVGTPKARDKTAILVTYFVVQTEYFEFGPGKYDAESVNSHLHALDVAVKRGCELVSHL